MSYPNVTGEASRLQDGKGLEYHATPEGGMTFRTKRRIGEVRIPNYVWDMWLPILGADAIGVYGIYCRLERAGHVKGLTQAAIAAAARCGPDRLRTINTRLERCGFISIDRPTGSARLQHRSSVITVLDPPTTIAAEILTELAHPGGYEPLTKWLFSAAPEQLDPSSGWDIQLLDEKPDPSSTTMDCNPCIATLDVADAGANSEQRESVTAMGQAELDARRLVSRNAHLLEGVDGVFGDLVPSDASKYLVRDAVATFFLAGHRLTDLQFAVACQDAAEWRKKTPGGRINNEVFNRALNKAFSPGGATPSAAPSADPPRPKRPNRWEARPSWDRLRCLRRWSQLTDEEREEITLERPDLPANGRAMCAWGLAADIKAEEQRPAQARTA